MASTKALVISGFGVNCEYETAHSIEQVGGEAHIHHLNKLIEHPSILESYNFLVFPGGFAFADYLGSGKVFSNKINYKLKDQLKQFVNSGKLIMGICNGFQVLAKIGLLPYPTFEQKITLTSNDSGKFEDRWVKLKINKNSPCIFTKNMEYLDLPIRHGEGKLVPRDDEILLDIINSNLFIAQYVDPMGRLARYPHNPNGSVHNIAGICDATGRVLGLMPHPECFNHYTNHPLWTKYGKINPNGLKIFENAVKYLRNQDV